VRETAFLPYQTNQFFSRHKFHERRIRARKILLSFLSAILDGGIPAAAIDSFRLTS